jgi:hypothetical protein
MVIGFRPLDNNEHVNRAVQAQAQAHGGPVTRHPRRFIVVAFNKCLYVLSCSEIFSYREVQRRTNSSVTPSDIPKPKENTGYAVDAVDMKANRVRPVGPVCIRGAPPTAGLFGVSIKWMQQIKSATTARVT